MPPTSNPTLEDTVCEWLKQNADEIEKEYGIYLDESITHVIKQTIGAVLCAMKCQSNLIRKNEG
jgi:hypothetical protein